MKGLMTGLAVVAIANVLAIGGLLFWLVKSDRLDIDRARKLREIVSVTLTNERADEEAKKKALEEGEKAQAVAKKESQAPLTAAEQLAARLEATELDRQRAARLKREVADLQAGLAMERAKLDDEWRKLRTAQTDHAAQVDQNLTTVGSEQFQKTLTVLSKLEPKESKAILSSLLAGAGVQPVTGPNGNFAPVNAAANTGAAAASSPGVPPLTPPTKAAESSGRPTPSKPGMPQVLAYLDSMEDKVRTAIVQEFVKEDPVLAGELLEALRVRGTFAAVSPASP